MNSEHRNPIVVFADEVWAIPSNLGSKRWRQRMAHGSSITKARMANAESRAGACPPVNIALQVGPGRSF